MIEKCNNDNDLRCICADEYTPFNPEQIEMIREMHEKQNESMDEVIGEAGCVKCIHNGVCKYKEVYMEAYKTVINTKVCCKEQGICFAHKSLTTLEFLSEIIIACKYRTSNEVLK